jgi:hypothetical protein
MSGAASAPARSPDTGPIPGAGQVFTAREAASSGTIAVQKAHASASAPDPTRTSAFRGAAPFEDSDEDQQLFFGREAATEELRGLIAASRLVVLFAKSGTGKTSLINAGLLPALRAQRYFPVVARLGPALADEASARNGDRLAAEIVTAFEDAVANPRADMPQVRAVKSEDLSQEAPLWSYFHRTTFQRLRPDPRGFERWEELRPVIILDQFEELLRLDNAERNRFFSQLGDLVANRVPADASETAVKRLAALEAAAGGTEAPGGASANRAALEDERHALADLALGRRDLAIKFLISMREDYLPQVQELEPFMPSILRTTQRLRPLTIPQARQVITDSPARLSDNQFKFRYDAVEAILNFLRAHGRNDRAPLGETIDPTQLQILCSSIEQRRRPDQTLITPDDLGGSLGMERIIEKHYRAGLEKLRRFRWGPNARRWRPAVHNLLVCNFPRIAAARLCEDGLVISGENRRDIMPQRRIARRYGVGLGDLERLVRSRLLNREIRNDQFFYELAHDALVPILQAARSNRKQGLTVAAAAIGAAALLFVASKIPDLVDLWRVPRWRALLEQTGGNASERENAIRSLSERHLKVRVVGDLAGVNLSGLFLEGIEVRDGALHDVRFTDIKGRNSFFTTLQMADVGFGDADLRQSQFTHLTLGRIGQPDEPVSVLPVSFVGADLRKALFSKAELVNVSFQNANLYEANFSQSPVSRSPMTGRKVNFNGSNWWLAEGLSVEERQALAGTTDPYVGTPRYTREYEQRRDDANDCTLSREDRASALNTYAWFLIVNGADMTPVNTILNHANNLKGERKDLDRAIRHNRALMHLRQEENAEAVELLKQLIDEDAGAAINRTTLSRRYQLSIALRRQNDSEYLTQRVAALNNGYVPQYELPLIETPYTPPVGNEPAAPRESCP